MNTNDLILDLSKELLDDIELLKITGEQLLLKTKRLVRLTADYKIDEWLNYELRGYVNTDNGKILMTKTGRWTDYSKGEGYWQSLSEIEASIEAQRLKLNCLRMPDLAGDKALLVSRELTISINRIGSIISIFSGIKSRVLSMIHEYVTEIYYKYTLNKIINSIFDSYKEEIDGKITVECRDVIEMLPSVMNRLQEKDQESISHALLSCRRIIETFSDIVYPATGDTIQIDGDEISLTKDKVKNRIVAYIHDKVNSKSRKKRLKQNLTNLYERVSVGVHDEVTFEEARALVFNTYLIIGEILNLSKPDATALNESVKNPMEYEIN